MESVNCESETLRKFDEKREVFWQPARLGEIGRAHRAARHGKMARGLCLGPEARHEHGSGTARPAQWPVQARRHAGTAWPAGPSGRAGTARWPSIMADDTGYSTHQHWNIKLLISLDPATRFILYLLAGLGTKCVHFTLR